MCTDHVNNASTLSKESTSYLAFSPSFSCSSYYICINYHIRKYPEYVEEQKFNKGNKNRSSTLKWGIQRGKQIWTRGKGKKRQGQLSVDGVRTLKDARVWHGRARETA